MRMGTGRLMVLVVLVLMVEERIRAQSQEEELTYNYQRPQQQHHGNEQHRPTKRPQGPGGGGGRNRFSTTKQMTKQTGGVAMPSATPKQTTSSKLGSKLTSPLLSFSPVTPPFTYSTEHLNHTHANMFKKWLDTKSNSLYELSMNFSGYKLLNETLNKHLGRDAKPAWINFTEMIVNISNTISEVLYNKTLVVKNLTDVVEKAFDEYRNDTRRVRDSAKFIYYDAKSSKTFCDMVETMNARRANITAMLTPTTTSTTTSTTSSSTTAKSPTGGGSSTRSGGKKSSISSSSLADESASSTQPAESLPDNGPVQNEDAGSRNKRAFYSSLDINDGNQDSLNFMDVLVDDPNLPEYQHDNEGSARGSKNCDSSSFLINYKYHLNGEEPPQFSYSTTTSWLMDDDSEFDTPYGNRSKRQSGGGGGGAGGARRQGAGGGGGARGSTIRPGGARPGASKMVTRYPNGSRITTIRPSTPSASTLSSGLSDNDEEEQEEGSDYNENDEYFELEMLADKKYWNITCLNRSVEENFKMMHKGVNKNVSTIHVPTNVYKQELIVNMTAFWTEGLNEHFRKNYEQDNELFWQYFCSSQGLYRRYPGSYWSTDKSGDFFDCRLQSWYIMAAASPKDVLILLDVSGSMTGIQFGIAKKLIESILDTLSDNDFFNVLVFSKSVDYLMNMDNETMYRNRFVQAGKTNKQVFINRLKWFYNTSDISNYVEALKMSFELLLNKSLGEGNSCNCNKVIMIITDGASENAEEVFKKYNWENGRQVRVFTFLIGRGQTDHHQVEWMACANDGRYFHVATIADVDEHVHEYIPVLSRPMALAGHHETTWSNVFVGHLDKELKIAVARPAFKTKESLMDKIDFKEDNNEQYYIDLLAHLRMQDRDATTVTPPFADETEYNNDYYYNSDYQQQQYDQHYYYQGNEGNEEGSSDYQSPKKPESSGVPKQPSHSSHHHSNPSGQQQPHVEYDDEEMINLLKETDKALRSQQVLLGVVGVDVPVLRLISKVSPKYQMGVGIYIIMLDNNGFIVFHPSIKKEIATTDFNFKGTSSSIDLDRFEIPINNDDAFEDLEHKMINQETGNMTLDNWKREGLRVIRRRTEYVFTPVSKTPFSVAIASPSSFGRYYIDLPASKEHTYENRIRNITQNSRFDTNIQLYNCSYSYARLADRILNPNQYSDYCIHYLFQDRDQVVAIKSDLVLHDIYYKQFNFSIFLEHPNLVKSSFYGTYSGITYYLPVTFYHVKPPVVGPFGPNKPTMMPGQQSPRTTTTTTTTTTTRRTTTAYEDEGIDVTDLPSEMTIDVRMGSIDEPSMKGPTKPTVVNGKNGDGTKSSEQNETYWQALNLFSDENNKHTYSFEKGYYTRSIEFSDYLRTAFRLRRSVVSYTLNESKDARRESVSATIPIWLDKVPASVAGVVYDAQLLQFYLFENFMAPGCEHHTCKNLCSQKREMNITCYLVDEHGIVVLSTQAQLSKQKEPIMGQPLYKINPWLMKILEFEGIYNLAIPGRQLPDCKRLPSIRSSAASLRHILSYLFNLTLSVLKYFADLFVAYTIVLATSGTQDQYAYAQVNTQTLGLAERIKIFNNEWRGKNSHCDYFGVYSFNLTKWKSLDAGEMRVWCNSTNSHPKKFLAGYVKHSNLIMLVVEDEYELVYCGNMSQLIAQYTQNSTDLANSTNATETSTTGLNETIPVVLSDATGNEENSTINVNVGQTLLEKPPPAAFQLEENYVAQEDIYSRTNDQTAYYSNDMIAGNEYSEGGGGSQQGQNELTFDYKSGSDTSGILSATTTTSVPTTTSIPPTEDNQDYTVNRYRKRPTACTNFFLNEREYLPCKSSSATSLLITLLYHILPALVVSILVRFV